MCRKQQKPDSFTTKLKEWHEHFEGNDRNSITNTLHDIIWITAVFRVINESRSYTKQPDGSYINNAMVHNFIDKCFIEYQFTAIRRLLDKNKKRTFSLYALICDMKDNHHLITRFNYFKAYNIEYNVEKTKKQYEEYTKNQLKAGNHPYFVPNSLNWQEIERRHSIFDILANNKNNKRKPTDTVQKDFFENLKNKLDQLDDIRTYANVFIAHLANFKDRKKNNIEDINITLDEIWNAHEVICKVATLISKTFLNGCGGFLGLPQFDQFENIERPFVEQKDIPKLKEIWDIFFIKTESWAYFDINNYEEFIKNGKTQSI